MKRSKLLVSSIAGLGLLLLLPINAFAIFRWAVHEGPVVGGEEACRNGMILYVGWERDDVVDDDSTPMPARVIVYHIGDQPVNDSWAIERVLFDKEGNLPPADVSITAGTGATKQLTHLIVIPVFWSDLVPVTPVYTGTAYLDPDTIGIQVVGDPVAPGTKAEFFDDTIPIENCYLVKKGDTLYSIAEKVYGDWTRWRDIARVNKIWNPKGIYRCQRLTLPY